MDPRKFSDADAKVIEGMRGRYKHLPALIFQRSIEKSRSTSELFDILESIPKKLPLIWDENSRKWAVTDDLLCAESFRLIQ